MDTTLLKLLHNLSNILAVGFRQILNGTQHFKVVISDKIYWSGCTLSKSRECCITESCLASAHILTFCGNIAICLEIVTSAEKSIKRFRALRFFKTEELICANVRRHSLISLITCHESYNYQNQD